jgi:hypothetical protein
VNHVNAGPVKDRGKYLMLKASSAEASPSCIRYRAMCSTVLVSSCPENLVNYVGTSTLFGSATLWYHSGKGDVYTCP